MKYERKVKKMKTESKRKMNNKKYRKSKQKKIAFRKNYSNIFQDSNVLSKC